jgi:hypothetical protein
VAEAEGAILLIQKDFDPAVQHELTPAEYRERFGLKTDYPMAAPKYVQKRREVALATGLGRPQKPARRGRKAVARPRADGQQRSDNAGA